MPEIVQDRLLLMPLVYAIAGYFVVQAVMSLMIRLALRRRGTRAILAVTGAFWASVVGALYLVVISAVLHIWNLAPNATRPPANMLWWGLAGVPLGVVLWYLLVAARRFGIAVFGVSQLVAAEDAILNLLPHPRYLGWGLINLAVLQPLGRELFMRAVFLPSVALNLGWGWAVGSTLVIELWMRMNVVWLFANLLYVLAMCGLFYLSGNALCGLVAASVAGLLHGIALAYISVKAMKTDESESRDA
jgi:hypothetical protein